MTTRDDELLDKPQFIKQATKKDAYWRPLNFNYISQRCKEEELPDEHA